MGVNVTMDEFEIVMHAVSDIIQKGNTDKKCPRCGSDLCIIDKYSYGCKKDGCIKLTNRGI